MVWRQGREHIQQASAPPDDEDLLVYVDDNGDMFFKPQEEDSDSDDSSEDSCDGNYYGTEDEPISEDAWTCVKLEQHSCLAESHSTFASSYSAKMLASVRLLFLAGVLLHGSKHSGATVLLVDTLFFAGTGNMEVENLRRERSLATVRDEPRTIDAISCGRPSLYEQRWSCRGRHGTSSLHRSILPAARSFCESNHIWIP